MSHDEWLSLRHRLAVAIAGTAMPLSEHYAAAERVIDAGLAGL